MHAYADCSLVSHTSGRLQNRSESRFSSVKVTNIMDETTALGLYAPTPTQDSTNEALKDYQYQINFDNKDPGIYDHR